MRLFNVDVGEAELVGAESIDDDEPDEEELFEDDAEADSCRTFFELRQRTLIGMDQMSAFRLVALGVVRKLRTNLKGSILYGEIEDALGRYFRLLDGDMQKFATLHETLRDAADKQDPKKAAAAASPMRSDRRSSGKAAADVATAMEAAHSILLDAMREIAVVLLACGEMQRRALELKMGAQRSIAEHREGFPCTVSFLKFADFLEEALAVCDQLRRKHEELHQQRIRAMATAAEARSAAAASSGPPQGSPRPAVGGSPQALSFSPAPRSESAGLAATPEGGGMGSARLGSSSMTPAAAMTPAGHSAVQATPA